MKDLPSVAKNIGKSIQRANKIYINESLTSYRNRLFGRIHKLKKSNKFKFLWTINGKISLRESKTRFTNLQLMKNLKNFWIYEAKKHSSCYFNSIYLLCFYCYQFSMAVDFNSEYANLCDCLPFSHLDNCEFQSVIGCWSIDLSKLKSDLFDIITNPDKFDGCDPDHILALPTSDYQSVSEMNSTFGKAGSNALTLFHCNTRSLPKNLSLLHDILYCLDSRSNIIAISKTIKTKQELSFKH